jgi:EAL domain-containing protein (putative c-di-GMP-specific phosphodiesterase class I)
VPVSVNLSAYQLGEPDLGQAVARSLHDTATEPDLLQLEITESAVMRDLDISLRVLASLKELGVRLALDDFGLGHSSLIYLKQLPVTTLKVDRAFVSGVATNPDDRAIVAAVVAMAHSLGLEVVAEGVETPEQLSAIRALGCDTIQGYLYSKPVAAEEAAVLLRERLSRVVV